MHDIVIRGGVIIDGTGKAAFTGDVAIAGDRIAAVGGKLGPARREIDAAGLLVTPGWVDVHTHYDGQSSGRGGWRAGPNSRRDCQSLHRTAPGDFGRAEASRRNSSLRARSSRRLPISSCCRVRRQPANDGNRKDHAARVAPAK